MPNIDLTDKERLILANQYEILAALKDDEHYALMAETLRNGHKWLYRQFFDSLSENLPDAEAEYVLTVLDIYSGMIDSYAKLTDKTGIDDKTLTFPGFDGNDESELLNFADSLIKHGRFESVLGTTARNSHMPTTAIYQRMIEAWTELGKPSYPYAKETIQKILASRIHPDHRK